MKKLLFIGLLIAACSEPKEVQAPQKTTEPVQNRVLKKSLPYTDHQGKTHKYTLSFPESYLEQEAVPVLVYLHGSGGNENSELGVADYIDNMLLECNARYPLIVYPSDENKLYILEDNYHIAFGLLDEIAKEYSIANASKRMIAGFSDGASAASRAPIINPGSYALSFSWSGWIWAKDTTLFDAVGNNAEQLNRLGYKAVYFTGDSDHPNAYNKLITYLEPNNIQYELTVLDDQGHNLGLYHQRTRTQFKTQLCRLFAQEQ